ncbi:MAG TPA: serine hydrolase domain-containing protein [Vicinamibacterales bacterium]|jgi:CubicO group peptidase (beta-lactamase class C family)|nr:serine hydrolase domain-containing protein [Vicinamibacterales bacterium]
MSKMTRSWIVVAFVCLVATLPLTGAGTAVRPEDVGLSSERLQQVNALVKRHLDAKSFAGAVTLVARNGRIAHLQAHGFAELESKKPMQTDNMFRIMSMTKPIVGTAIMMMMEEGKVRLTDPVSKFIPELKGMQVAVAQPGPAAPPAAGAPAEPRYYTVPADHEFTVRELLTHTSGLVSGSFSGAANRKVVLKGQESLSDYLPRLAQTPLEFQPGTRWAYSAQAGFDVLLHIVEITSGMQADQFLKTRLFDPLGMKDTFYYPVENPRLAGRYDRQPDGTLRRNTSTPNFLNGRYFGGGGGLASTAEDYFQFAQMLLNGGQLNGKRLLSPRAVEMMASVMAPDTLPGRQPGEAFGLSMRVVNNPAARNTAVSPGTFGWSGAYGTHFWIDPKEKVIGILMAQTPNQEIRGDFENAVAFSVLGASQPSGTH